MTDLLDLLDAAGGQTCVCHPAPSGGWRVDGFTEDHRSLSLWEQSMNLYISVNPLHPALVKQRSKHGRGSKQHREIAAYRAAHCELDYAKGLGYPPDYDAALGFLHNFPLQPSVIIWSGGGFHCWWILEQPFPLKPDNDRGWKIALDIEARWKHLFLTELVAAGWVRPNGEPGIDTGTFDLSRVLRVPGTINGKRGNTVTEIGGTGAPVPNAAFIAALPEPQRIPPTRLPGESIPDLNTDPMCWRMAKFTTNSLHAFDHSDRHNWLARKTFAALIMQSEGHRGAEYSLTALVDAFRAAVTAPDPGGNQRTRGTADAEALRLIEGARRLTPPPTHNRCTCY